VESPDRQEYAPNNSWEQVLIRKSQSTFPDRFRLGGFGSVGIDFERLLEPIEVAVIS
jgi:hypothetical protein